MIGYNHNLFLAEFIMVHESQLPADYVDGTPVPSGVSFAHKIRMILALSEEEAKQEAWKHWSVIRNADWKGWRCFAVEISGLVNPVI